MTTRGFDPNDILRCSESTITEAWVVIRGGRYVISDDTDREPESIFNQGKKQISGLEKEPTFVVVDASSGQTANPFWINQSSWDGKRRRCRIGYSYLSVHRVCNPESGDKYDRFASEIEPYLKDWLKIYERGALSAKDQTVESVLFGYTNRFHFQHQGDFETSEYINFEIAVDIGKESNQASMLTAEANFRFLETAYGDRINFSVTIANEKPKTVLLQTSSQVEVDVARGVHFESIDEIQRYARRAQKASKNAFFSAVTDKTRVEILKADFRNEKG